MQEVKMTTAIIVALTLAISLTLVTIYLLPQGNAPILQISEPQEQIPWQYLALGLTVVLVGGATCIVLAIKRMAHLSIS